MSNEQVPVTPGSPANPAEAQPGQPPANPPVNPPVANPNPLELQVKDLNSKIETLTRQYTGSSEEAIRLKQENEKLQRELEAAKSNPAMSEDKLQKLVDEKGLLGALETIFGPKFSALESQVNGLLTEKSVQIFDSFKSTHKGLENPEVLKRYDEELARLKNVYNNPVEAMEKAYVLAGGPQAEKPSTPPPPPAPAPNSVVNQIIGGEQDNRPAPLTADETAKIKEQIDSLTYQAALLDRNGKPGEGARILVQVEELRSKLKG